MGAIGGGKKGTYGVPSIQAHVVRVLEQWQRFLFIENPFLPFRRSVAHCAENHLGDLEA